VVGGYVFLVCDGASVWRGSLEGDSRVNSTRVRAAFGGFAGLAFFTWIAAAATTVVQKLNADKTIRGNNDVSQAIRNQQLNSSVITHALTMLLVACAVTIPLLVVAVYAIAVRTSE
jgi:hypothetical protein